MDSNKQPYFGENHDASSKNKEVYEKMNMKIVFLLVLVISVSNAETTKEDAISAIETAELEIKQMSDAGFSVLFAEDTLKSAKQALQRANFVETIELYPGSTVAEGAKEALEGIDYEGFSYENVLVHTQKITERKDQAFLLRDTIRALEIKLEKGTIGEENAKELSSLLEEAKNAFDNERYEETEALLINFSEELENKKIEESTLNATIKASRGFIEKNWPQLLIFLIIISVISWYVWKRVEKKRLKSTLERMRQEMTTLKKLMKRTQEERFSKGTLSGLIYNIRMDTYRRKMNNIKEKMPVIESQLKNITKKKAI
jgi:hypothetical protein